MIRCMRPLWISLVLAAALALPLAALAADAPPPAVVSACQAEAAQLGKDAFVAKYGPTEPFGHCYAAHTATVSTDDPATAACKAEYLKIGATAFIAKYGATETLGNCRTAYTHTTTTTTSTPKPPQGADDASKGLAQLLCSAEAKTLGKDAFVAKYGKEASGQCVKAMLAKARQLVAACKASSGSSKDAFKACLAAAATKRR